MKNSMWFLKILKIKLPYDSAILLLWIYLLNWKEGLKYICTIMFIAVFFTIARRWRNPSVYTYNIIILKKDKHSNMCHNMGEPSGHYILSEINWSLKGQNSVWFYLYEVSKPLKFHKTESRMVLSRSLGKRARGYCWLVTEF